MAMAAAQRLVRPETRVQFPGPRQVAPTDRPSPSRHRILRGESILFRMRARPATVDDQTFAYQARVLYDNGITEDFKGTHTNTSSSSVNPWVARDTFGGQETTGGTIDAGSRKQALLDGFVLSVASVQLDGTTFLRGEGFVEAFTSGADATRPVDLLAQAHQYGIRTSAEQRGLVLDRFDRLGPGSVLPTVIIQATDNPAANTQHAAVAVPTGHMWKIKSYFEAVAAFSAASKSVSIVSAANDIVGISDEATPAAAAGAIRAYPGATSGFNTVLNGFVFPIDGDKTFVAGDTIQVTLNGIAATDDLAAGSFLIEDWMVAA